MANYPYASEPLASGFPEGILTSTLNEDTAVGGLTDNHTAVNKAGIKSTLGRQVALIQNFVNSRYLGREDIPIQDAYISGVHIDTLISNSYVAGVNDGDIYLCSNLLPISTITPSLKIGSETNKFGYIYSKHARHKNVEAYTPEGTATGADGVLFIKANATNGYIVNYGHLRPYTDNYYDLGLSTQEYRYGFINTIFTGTIAGSNTVTVGITPHNNTCILCGDFITASGDNSSTIGAAWDSDNYYIHAGYFRNLIISNSTSFQNVPTSDPGISGRLWRSGTDLYISNG